jgi:error-prone DNA polymerase
MGFYAPAQIVRDAREHDVEVRAIDVAHSDWNNKLEAGKNGPAVRLGLRQIDGFREDWAMEIMRCRPSLPERDKAAQRIEALARAAGLPSRALRLLADADAFRSYGYDRRQALWEVRRTPTDALPLFAAADARELGAEADPHLPTMPLSEHVATDYQTTRLSLKAHPMAFLRPLFAAERVSTCAGMRTLRDGARAKVAGVVLVRQRPGGGKAIFITLEDETGIANVLLWARDFEKYRRPVMASRLMEVRGIVQKSPEGVVHLMGAHVVDRTAVLDHLSERTRPPNQIEPRGSHPRNVRILPASRDFH